MTGDLLLPFHLSAVQQNFVSNNCGDINSAQSEDGDNNAFQNVGTCR